MLIEFKRVVWERMEIISPQRAAKEKHLRFGGNAIDKLISQDKIDHTIFDDGHVKIKFIVANTKYRFYFKKPNYQEVWHWMKYIAKKRSPHA